MEMFSTTEMKELLKIAEKQLALIFEVTGARVYFVDSKNKKFLRCSPDNELSSFDINSGLIGEAYHKNTFLNVVNAYEYPSYNGMIDIGNGFMIVFIRCVRYKYACNNKTSKK